MWKWSVATTATVLNSDSQLGERKLKLVPTAAEVNSDSWLGVKNEVYY